MIYIFYFITLFSMVELKLPIPLNLTDSEGPNDLAFIEGLNDCNEKVTKWVDENLYDLKRGILVRNSKNVPRAAIPNEVAGYLYDELETYNWNLSFILNYYKYNQQLIKEVELKFRNVEAYNAGYIVCVKLMEQTNSLALILNIDDLEAYAKEFLKGYYVCDDLYIKYGLNNESEWSSTLHEYIGQNWTGIGVLIGDIESTFGGDEDYSGGNKLFWLQDKLQARSRLVGALECVNSIKSSDPFNDGLTDCFSGLKDMQKIRPYIPGNVLETMTANDIKEKIGGYHVWNITKNKSAKHGFNSTVYNYLVNASDIFRAYKDGYFVCLRIMESNDSVKIMTTQDIKDAANVYIYLYERCVSIKRTLWNMENSNPFHNTLLTYPEPEPDPYPYPDEGEDLKNRKIVDEKLFNKYHNLFGNAFDTGQCIGKGLQF